MEYVPVTVHTGEPGTRNEELLSKRFIQHGDRWRKVHTLNDVKTRQRHGENWGLLKGDITRNTWNIIKPKLGQENQIWAGKHKAEGDKLWHYGRPWRVAPPKKMYWGNSSSPGGAQEARTLGGALEALSLGNELKRPISLKYGLQICLNLCQWALFLCRDNSSTSHVWPA